jgi:hypothetical protein
MNFRAVLGIVRAMGDLRYSTTTMQEISIFCDDTVYNGTSLTSLDLEATNTLKQWHLCTYMYNRYRVSFPG